MSDSADTDDGEARRLLAVAMADIAPGGDLLAGVQARRRASRRYRAGALVSASTVTAGVVGVMVTAGTAPNPARPESALAAFTAAVTKTTAQSFELTETASVTGDVLAYPPPETGVFDPARAIGAVKHGQQTQTIFADGWRYIRRRGAAATGPEQKPWIRFRAPFEVPITGLAPVLGTSTFSTANPQDLLGLLKSAAGVRPGGPASGPGWTGTSYTFSWSQSADGVAMSGQGSVAVDSQGRVRVLTLTRAYTGEGGRPAQISTRTTFGDFGVRFSVQLPPLSEVNTQGAP